ncbi:MAG: hypothetical protein HGGPFJEG_00140 [Ignavibacteria bacterium]|nr:hypothetical protein [Ignavibacteria bacterium]
MIKELSAKNFDKFRMNLIYFAKRFRISFEDAEEIVNDSILKALENFDFDKGNFEAFCKVILKNRVLNFIRDYKEILIFGYLDNENYLEETFAMYNKEKKLKSARKKFTEVLTTLISSLDKKEKTFLNCIYKNLEYDSKLNISKSAKMLGMSTQQGWNLFRQIQRKAKYYIQGIEEFGYLKEMDYLEIGKIKHSYKESRIMPKMFCNESFEMYEYIVDNENKSLGFIKSLTPAQQEMLNSIYG